MTPHEAVAHLKAIVQDMNEELTAKKIDNAELVKRAQDLEMRVHELEEAIGTFCDFAVDWLKQRSE